MLELCSCWLVVLPMLNFHTNIGNNICSFPVSLTTLSIIYELYATIFHDLFATNIFVFNLLTRIVFAYFVVTNCLKVSSINFCYSLRPLLLVLSEKITHLKKKLVEYLVSLSIPNECTELNWFMCTCVVVKHGNLYSKGILWENIRKIALKIEMRQVFLDHFFFPKRTSKRGRREYYSSQRTSKVGTSILYATFCSDIESRNVNVICPFLLE